MIRKKNDQFENVDDDSTIVAKFHTKKKISFVCAIIEHCDIDSNLKIFFSIFDIYRTLFCEFLINNKIKIVIKSSNKKNK